MNNEDEFYSPYDLEGQPIYRRPEFSPDEFINNAKKTLSAIEKAYSDCYINRSLTDSEYDEMEKLNLKEGDDFKNGILVNDWEDGETMLRYFDSASFADKMTEIMFLGDKFLFMELIESEIIQK